LSLELGFRKETRQNLMQPMLVIRMPGCGLPEPMILTVEEPLARHLLTNGLLKAESGTMPHLVIDIQTTTQTIEITVPKADDVVCGGISEYILESTKVMCVIRKEQG